MLAWSVILVLAGCVMASMVPVVSASGRLHLLCGLGGTRYLRGGLLDSV